METIHRTQSESVAIGHVTKAKPQVLPKPPKQLWKDKVMQGSSKDSIQRISTQTRPQNDDSKDMVIYEEPSLGTPVDITKATKKEKVCPSIINKFFLLIVIILLLL